MFKNYHSYFYSMFLAKKGFPQEEELVLCSVTSVQPHSVFVTLDEYNNRTGMIHISEVAPGRIKNIRDFVQEGKKAICKVLKINPEKGHIDLSLRRVNEKQKQQKNNEIKQEQFAETIINHFAKQNKKEPKAIYELISYKLLDKYPSIYSLFEQVSLNNLHLKDIGIPKETADSLTEFIKQRIKPPEVVLEGEFTLISYAPNGVELIKNTILNATAGKENIKTSYSGGGVYRVIVKSTDYKSAERIMQKVSESILNSKNSKITAQFKKIEHD